MKEDINEIKEFVLNFIENYTKEIIEDDVVGFYNDALAMLQHFNNLKENQPELDALYIEFINHIIQSEGVLKEYTAFNFGSLKTLTSLRESEDFKKLTPIFTPYSFNEAEETINQIFEEIKSVKEFHKELKEEITYLLDEYQFHLDHIEENMRYNFYIYNELENVPDLSSFIEEFQIEKRKFIQKCNDKLIKK